METLCPGPVLVLDLATEPARADRQVREGVGSVHLLRSRQRDCAVQNGREVNIKHFDIRQLRDKEITLHTSRPDIEITEEILVTGRHGVTEDVVLAQEDEVIGGDILELGVSAVEPGEVGGRHGGRVHTVEAGQEAADVLERLGPGAHGEVEEDGGEVGAGHEVLGAVHAEVLVGVVLEEEGLQGVLVLIVISQGGLVNPVESVRQRACHTDTSPRV